MADHLTYDIIVIILSNLPVKSLLRFKCVSKSWCCWISNPNFQRRKQGQEGAITMLYKSSTSRKSSRRPSFSFMNKQLTSENLSCPLRKRRGIKYCTLLGSCHGLILFNVNKHIYLWNPATRFCTKVLELYHYRWDNLVTRGGLCFDSSKNDYKAVMFIYDGGPSEWDQFVAIASLKGKKWRQLKFAYDIISVRDGITLHGRLHYRVRDKKSVPHESTGDRFHHDKVIYFDPISEKFHMLPIPEPDQEEKENIVAGLGVLNECLCMTRLKHDGGLEILVMKEYGIKEPWKSLFFIKKLEIYHYGFGFVAPFSVTENGKFALIIDQIERRVAIYNPKNDNM
ncbi:F-box protein At3g07870-like [Lycium ferocissimum]|uniref:F-box protein At3g07870-like n=1 Tax=Lycium ferocissimum TaxID=112874 RepID=UPI002815F487|nr:F-box protein At3g07870-like [Lycium ferocissimum]